MKLIAQIVSSLVLAATSQSFEDDTPSLLQLKAINAASSEHTRYNASASSQPKSGHSFGCTGRSTAVNVIQCGLWGDVHQHQKFQGGGHPDSQGTGWYWMARSKDGNFGVQAFYRQHGGWTTMSHYALKFAEQVVFMDRVNNGNSWMWKYYWNGQEKSYTETPLDTPTAMVPVTWVNRAGGGMAPGQQSAQGLNAHGILTQYEAERHSCFEFGNVAVWTGYQNWQNVGMGPYGQPGILEIEGSQDYLDPAFGQCAGSQVKVGAGDIYVTSAQNDKVCADDGLEPAQCADPTPPPPPTPAEQVCANNNVDFQHARDLCAGQGSHGADIYDGCVLDVCASIDADAEQNAIGGAELEAAMANPRAQCLVDQSQPCKPCNICWDSTTVDLSNIVQNNLGGLGPDTGAQEIRYKNAILQQGRLVDVVLVANGAYATPKPERNGNNGQGFGRFTIQTGTSSDFTFLFQDANTGEAVGIQDLALTFYDLDEARNKLQRETVTACGAQEVYITEGSELEYTRSGTCHSFQSSVVGTGQDNPRSPDELTMTQAARSVTYEFHSRASISWSASVSGNRWNPRPVLFSFKPQVACGASDSQTQCSETRPLGVHFGAPRTNECLPASVDEAGCLAAVQALLPTGATQGRTSLVAGSWGWVPPGCSAQSGGDWAAHYNRGNGNNDGGYTPVCQGGDPPTAPACSLSAYWEYGGCGCGGNDQNQNWCGGIGDGKCPDTVQTGTCPGGTAYLTEWHPKPYNAAGHRGQGTPGHLVRDGCEYIWHAQYGCQEPQFDCALSAYWEYGSGGCGGNDQNTVWCGGTSTGNCPDTIQTNICPSGTAYLAVWHPKPYDDAGHRGQGTPGHYIRDGVEYIWHAQYACQ